MSNNHTTFKDYLHLHFIVFIWGFTAILGKLISLPSFTLVFWRTLISYVSLGIIFIIIKKPLITNKQNAVKFILVGSLIGLHWVTFFASAKISNISICLAGISTSSLWTSLLEPLFTKKKFKIFDFIMSLIIICGLYLIFLFEFDKKLGLLVSLFSAFILAIFNLINKNISENNDANTVTFYELLGANLITLLALIAINLFSLETSQIIPTFQDLFWLSFLALVCTVYPFVASLHLLKKFSAFTMSLTVNLEPVYGIILAYLFFGDSEHMSSGFYIGAFIIFFTVMSYPFMERRATNRKSLRDL